MVEEERRARVKDVLKRTLAEKAAELIRRDPERAATALEMGVVDREWLDDPSGDRPVGTSTPTEVLERFLERAVEDRPSLLGSLGLSALQILSGSGESADGSLQVMTIAFTDLEGFTRFTAEQGDDVAARLLREHYEEVTPVVRQSRGRVVKHLGDGLLLAFPAADGAVRAVLNLIDLAPAPLRLRAGLHHGEAMVTRTDVLGHAVNLAARVTEEASGGQVLVTTEVCDAVGELTGVRFTRARRLRLKGIDGRVSVCEVKRA
jgi:adenylate cyclase